MSASEARASSDNVRERPTASSKVCKAITSHIDRIVDKRVKESARFFSREKTIQKNDTGAIERLAPQAIITDGWTAEDEEWLQNLWGTSILKAELEKKPPVYLTTIWKATTALMGCSPCAIISPKHSIQWQPALNSEGERVVDDDNDNDSAICIEGFSLWSRSFFDRLKTLVCHPIWRRDATVLATAIQVAVVCSMDYRGQWMMAFKGTNPEMQAIGAKMAVGTAASNQSVREALQQQRQTGIARGETVSMELDFLCHLASQVAGVSSSRGQREGAVMLPVTSVDLQAVIDAIDGFCPSGIPMFIDTLIAREIADGVISNKSFPAAKEVPQLHERAILHEFRMYFRREPEATGEPDATREPNATREPDATRGLSRSASLPIRAGTAPAGTKRDKPLYSIEEDEASRGRKRARHQEINESGDEDNSRDEGDLPDVSGNQDGDKENLPGGDNAPAGAGRARSRYSNDLGHGGSLSPSPHMPGRHGDASNMQGEDDVGAKSGEAVSGQEYSDDARMEEAVGASNVEAAGTEPVPPGQGHGGDDDVPMNEAADTSVQSAIAGPANADGPIASAEELREHERKEWPKQNKAILDYADEYEDMLTCLQFQCTH
ncbi:uncharacterized protein UV8b_05741 [Ustilaginoidea virens]|uniref:Uncharacterized protein n=1 Tax=Ustilaginoidea virens TaxID=1159556 RepID=A0A8E5MIE7_USTVR|nr:uncharacterized protein UV8b_05741 [Ustilaginoidea virens]QUC21498.1 hypothetical protein UV8b_05741 [Ustilaginoidea virens]